MRASLLMRATIAIVLMFGFYVLALGVAAGLLWIVYAQFAIARRFSIKLSVLCVLGAFAILAAIVPRPDHFTPPGPELTRSKHPKLFAMIDEIADLTGQARPAEVYLVNDMNAFVAQRGGFMGFFSRRVMGLGLPLLQVLSVSQLRAVLAHEFGHFHGGDVQVGPWIYKTRSAIGRTIMSLGDGLLQKPFAWYGNLFLRITQAISRRQEYAADALAAKVVGAKHLIDGLKVVHGGALAFTAYWQSEYIPAVAAGFRPPLAQGFSQFMSNERLTKAVDEAVSKELENDEENPFDTHPPLPRRIEALASSPSDGEQEDTRRAIELLGGKKRLEKDLLATIVVDDHFAKLKVISWSDAPARVYLPQWQEQAAKDAQALATMSPRKIPTTVAGMVKLAPKLFRGEVDDLRALNDIDDKTLAHAVADRLAGTFAVALIRRGWALGGEVGEAFTFEKDGQQLEVFRQLHELVDGKLSADEWRTALEVAGVERMRLVPKEEQAA